MVRGMTKEEKYRQMIETPVNRLIPRLAIPTIISMLVTSIYNMADTFFVGQTQNPLQVAAVSLTNPIFVMYMAISQLIGIGGSTLISIFLGKRKNGTNCR